MSAYSVCDDGEIECPACGHEWKEETWAQTEGGQTECRACGLLLEISEVDYSRTLYWSTADSVRWHEFGRFWYQLGWRIHVDAKPRIEWGVQP